MRDELSDQSGQVASTPEAGPIGEGAPAQEPGPGVVRATPEGGPLLEDQPLAPPTWREQMRGPIPGLDETAAGAPPRATAAPGQGQPGEATRVPITVLPGTEASSGTAGRGTEPEAESHRWPSYSGKPVSEVRWQDAGRYVAPVANQAAKLAISAIGLTGRGLEHLAQYLEARRQERETARRRQSNTL